MRPTRPTFRPTCVPLEDRTTPAAIPSLATGAAAGQPPEVRVSDSDGAELARFLAYDAAFTGGVNVALGDVTGDDVPDIVTAPKAGGSSNVRVFDGTNFSLVRSFYAFDVGFTGGANLAVADLTGDRAGDVIVGAGAGGGPQVKVFDGAAGGLAKSFYAFDPSFTGGVNVAATAARVTTTVFAPAWVPDPNAPPEDPRPAGATPTSVPIEGGLILVNRPPSTSRTSGSIVVGAGAGGGPQVTVFDADTLAVKSSFYAYDATFRGGVNVATIGVTIYTGSGDGGGSNVRVFALQDSATYALTASFVAGTATDVHGVTVGTDSGGIVALVPNGAGPPVVRTFRETTTIDPDGSTTSAVIESTARTGLPALGRIGSLALLVFGDAATPPIGVPLNPTT